MSSEYITSKQTRQKVGQVKACFDGVGGRSPTTFICIHVNDTKSSNLGCSKSMVGQERSPFFTVYHKPRSEKDTQTDFNTCMRHACYCQKTCKCTVRGGQQARLTESKLLVKRRNEPTEVTKSDVCTQMAQLPMTKLDGVSL